MERLGLLLKYFDTFSEVQLKQFAALKELFVEWNTKINVISRKDIDNFYEHHVLHSLAIAAKFEFLPGMEIMDLGSGGGFPGIPLAIFFPGTAFHLVDSINKKITVAAAIAKAIGLQNITTQHIRAEEISNSKFDTVVSRAVAPLAALWQWSRPLLQRSGFVDADTRMANGLVCLKGGDLTSEIFESGCKPLIWEIDRIFPEIYFNEKYILYIPLNK